MKWSNNGGGKRAYGDCTWPLYAGKPAEAADQFAIALKQRQRQLTRLPSEIYPVAMLYGKALYRMNKFDDAAVAFMTALKQRPSDEMARTSRADALIKANKADRWGNLTYLRSARNFNPVMAMAAELTVVEVDSMVELGDLDPEAVVTPSIFVDRVVVVGAHA